MRPEDSLQIRTVRWLRTALPLEVLWSGIEHAGQISLRQGAVRKAKGVRRGLPDLLFWHGGKSIAVELKTASGVQSDAQKDFMDRFRAAGGIYAVCRSEQDVELLLRAADVPVNFPAPSPWPPAVAPPKRERSTSSIPIKPRPDAAKLRAVSRLRGKGLVF